MAKVCKKCNMIYADHANVCYKCGGRLGSKRNPMPQDQEVMGTSKKKGHPILCIVAVFLIWGIVSNLGNSSQSSSNTTNQSSQTNVQSTSQEESDLQKKRQEYLSQFDWYNNDFGVKLDSAKSEYGIAKISGRAISINGKDYSYVQVEIGIYNENGSKIGSAYSTISNLKSGVTWQFEALGTVSSNKWKYKVEEVSGW
jgi:hypothetical protein